MLRKGCVQCKKLSRVWEALSSSFYSRQILGIPDRTARFRGIIIRSVSTKLTKDASNSRSRPKQLKISELDEDAARNELLYLNETVTHHSQLYYDSNEPEITDAQYDKLVKRATNIFGRFSNLRGLVPKLDEVGAASNGKFPPFTHSTPMLSLDNAFKEEELIAYLTKTEKLFRKNATAAGLVAPPATPLEYIIEPKIDGLSLALHYLDGQLVGAGTRGDGTMGEDVTTNVLSYIPCIPRTISTSHRFLEVRGEVYISKRDFAELNRLRERDSLALFSTARNAAAGSLRRIKPEKGNSTSVVSASDALIVRGDRKLKFLAYMVMVHSSGDAFQNAVNYSNGFKKHKQNDKSVLSSESHSPAAVADLGSTQLDHLHFLTSLGFPVAEPHTVCATSEEVLKTCSAFERSMRTWDFEADGAVLKVNHIAHQNLLGNGTRAPRWAVAYKFSGEAAETVLREIVAQVGRTGVLTPVALLEPVTIGGVRVERATLHNGNEVRRLGLFSGARVLVKRAGDVIPKVIGLAASAGGDDTTTTTTEGAAGVYEMPTHCPVCGSRTISEGSDIVRCTGGGYVCSAQAVEQISHFCSRDAADIDGVGGAKLEYLYTNGFIRTVLDLYTLREQDTTTNSSSGDSSIQSKSDRRTKDGRKSKNDASVAIIANGGGSLRGRKGWGDRSVNNLLASVDRSRRTMTMHRLLYGLGIRNIGLRTAKDISAEFGDDFSAFWDGLKAHGKGDTEYVSEVTDRLLSISGFGPVALQSLLDFAADERNVAVVDGLLEHLTLVNAGVAGGRSVAASTGSASATGSNRVHSGDNVTGGSEHSPIITAASAQPLAGRKVVFTGVLGSMSRREAQSIVERLGGEFHNSVNRTVGILVDCHGADQKAAAPLPSPGGRQRSVKAQRAEALGVEVWSEAEWMELVEKYAV